eukprot:scaffold291193_cov39-Tisochrysis_lutea.AAC.2
MSPRYLRDRSPLKENRVSRELPMVAASSLLVALGLLDATTAFRTPTVMGRSSNTICSRHPALVCQAEPAPDAVQPTADNVQEGGAVEAESPAPPAVPAGGCEFCGAAQKYGGCNGEGRYALPLRSMSVAHRHFNRNASLR